MIAKFLEPCAVFSGIEYNFNKIEEGKAELLKVANFGALQGMDQVQGQDYASYLMTQSKLNRDIEFPQLHVVISCKKRSHSKAQLTEIAEKWMEGMGYGQNPYMVVFHKDTKNNHVHIVSTRIDKQGAKINDSFEHLRSLQLVNKIMGLDEKQVVTKDIEKALAYQFSTRAQFMMLLEAKGYTLKLENEFYRVSKFGRHLQQVPSTMVDQIIADHIPNKNRLRQLKAIVQQYKAKPLNATLYPVRERLAGGIQGQITGYSSKLSEFLQQKFGLQLLFHFKGDKPLYAYTIMDHAQKRVYKGSEMMSLAELILADVNLAQQAEVKAETYQPELTTEYPINDYAEAEPVLDNLHNSSDIDVSTNVASAESSSEDFAEYDSGGLGEIRLDISDDIDDESILGRNRQRKKKARTNTR